MVKASKSNFYCPQDPSVRQEIAQWLLSSGAIKVNIEHPFKLTSGSLSPVYTDCRRLISFVKGRDSIVRHGKNLIESLGTFDVLAGGETAGIPYAAFLAQVMSKPMIYVRKKPKGFGMNALIEGYAQKNQSCLLVEDLATDGGSKVKFAQSIRDSGLICHHAFVVFFYGETSARRLAFQESGLSLMYLCSWSDVLAHVKKVGLWDSKTIKHVESFLES